MSSIKKLYLLKNNAFTLIEMMISLVLLSIILSIIYQGLISSYRQVYYQEISNKLQSRANIDFQRIIKDIQLAGLLISSNSTISGIDSTNSSDTLIIKRASLFPIAQVESINGTIKCLQDEASSLITSEGTASIIDSLSISCSTGDIQSYNATFSIEDVGMLLYPVETVTYSLSDNVLKRNNEVFLENVEDFQVAYFDNAYHYDETNNSSPDFSKVKAVKICVVFKTKNTELAAAQEVDCLNHHLPAVKGYSRRKFETVIPILNRL